MKVVPEVGSGKWDGQREPESRLVQLVDGDDYKRTSLRLLSTSRRIGVRPIDVTLKRFWRYHSGAATSKPDAISSLSAR